MEALLQELRDEASHLPNHPIVIFKAVWSSAWIYRR
jgi:hypothetical protein